MLDTESILRQALKQVTQGQTLSREAACEVTATLVAADLEDPRVLCLAAGLLCALKTRGEAVEEVVGAATCLRSHQKSAPVGATSALLDTCGTGGDGAHLINISTLAALTAASLGVCVAKHGNRSISSSCGSADLLEALGYPLLADGAKVANNVVETGFGFLFAPHYHPVLRRLSGLRQTLGLRTLFNLLGPLLNPAGATHQVIGVYDVDLVPLVAHAASELGIERVLVVHGEGGLDELSPFGTSWVTLSEVGSKESQCWEWTPATFGAPSTQLATLRGGDKTLNARIAREVLAGGRPEVASAVAMNTAAALWLVKHDQDLKVAYEKAYEALRRGAVGNFFERTLNAASRLN